jgi:uncharacterized protein (DUF2147 family)
LSCISVSGSDFRGANYSRGSRTNRASKSASTRDDKPRAPTGNSNSVSSAKTTKAEDAIAPSQSPKLNADLRPIVVAKEPEKAPLTDTPALPAPAVTALPSPADAIAAFAPISPTKPMPADATSDGSASPVDVAAAPSRPSSPSTGESAALPANTVYKPVQTTFSPAPAIEYYRKAKVDQKREDVGRPASLLGNWQTEGKKRSIHIEQCGPFVCGYAADSPNQDKVLIDLKPTSSSEWIGLIVSTESGIMYPSVVIVEDATTIRVRACALGVTFCEGQIWTHEAPVLAAAH